MRIPAFANNPHPAPEILFIGHSVLLTTDGRLTEPGRAGNLTDRELALFQKRLHIKDCGVRNVPITASIRCCSAHRSAFELILMSMIPGTAEFIGPSLDTTPACPIDSKAKNQVDEKSWWATGASAGGS